MDAPEADGQLTEPDPYDELLDLKIKAVACGIPLAKLADTPLEGIVFGWEAQCLIIEQHVRPVVAGQLSKVSATALGREKREEKRPPKDAKESENRARDKRDAEKGAPILQKIIEREYFQIMPAYRKAAWVREHGRWPGEAELAEALRLTDPELAREIITDLRDGHLKGFKLFIKDRKLVMKLSVTATLKRMRP